MSVKIKNWAKFQHFKDRRPPWVKLYRDLLDDREWHKLDGESAKLLVSLWLIGSEDSGNLPTVDELAFRLRLDEKHVEKCLKRLNHWLISERYQDDINSSQKISATDIEVPLRDREETEKETEREREREYCAEPQSDSTPENAVIQIPLVDQTDFGITEKHIAEWSESFPAVDVLQQLRSMRQWCLANPTRRKTKRGVSAFIVSWLTKEQDKGRSYAKPDQSGIFAGAI